MLELGLFRIPEFPPETTVKKGRERQRPVKCCPKRIDTASKRTHSPRSAALFSCGELPKFGIDAYCTVSRIPTVCTNSPLDIRISCANLTPFPLNVLCMEHPMSDRDLAGLRGPVATCVQTDPYPNGPFVTADEYSRDGRGLSRRREHGGKLMWQMTRQYDDGGRLLEITSTNDGQAPAPN